MLKLSKYVFDAQRAPKSWCSFVDIRTALLKTVNLGRHQVCAVSAQSTVQVEDSVLPPCPQLIFLMSSLIRFRRKLSHADKDYAVESNSVTVLEQINR